MYYTGNYSPFLFAEISPFYFITNTKFVFITGYSKYALDSFSVHPYDYILKPVDIEKVMSTLNILANMVVKEEINIISSEKIIIQNKSETIFIDLNDIIFIETGNRRCLIHSKNQIYITSKTLTELKTQLCGNFIQTHKSFIVNKSKISKIKQVSDRSYEVKFRETDKTALISRYKFEELKSTLIPS